MFKIFMEEYLILFETLYSFISLNQSGESFYKTFCFVWGGSSQAVIQNIFLFIKMISCHFLSWFQLTWLAPILNIWYINQRPALFVFQKIFRHSRLQRSKTNWLHTNQELLSVGDFTKRKQNSLTSLNTRLTLY